VLGEMGIFTEAALGVLAGLRSVDAHVSAPTLAGIHLLVVVPLGDVRRALRTLRVRDDRLARDAPRSVVTARGMASAGVATSSDDEVDDEDDPSARGLALSSRGDAVEHERQHEKDHARRCDQQLGHPRTTTAESRARGRAS